MKIEALHDFHDLRFSKGWADKFTPTKDRMDLFETMKSYIQKEYHSSAHILELGIGPGFLANYLLEKLPAITYEGLDYSEAMIDIASKRNKEYQDRIEYKKSDLTSLTWSKDVKIRPDVIVSTWALHDLFTKENIANVYKQSFEILSKGGMLLNGDFIKPEESKIGYEGGRIKPSEHILILKDAGFSFVECVKLFEIDVENPTTANNYACLKGTKK